MHVGSVGNLNAEDPGLDVGDFHFRAAAYRGGPTRADAAAQLANVAHLYTQARAYALHRAALHLDVRGRRSLWHGAIRRVASFPRRSGASASPRREGQSSSRARRITSPPDADARAACTCR